MWGQRDPPLMVLDAGTPLTTQNRPRLRCFVWPPAANSPSYGCGEDMTGFLGGWGTDSLHGMSSRTLIAGKGQSMHFFSWSLTSRRHRSV